MKWVWITFATLAAIGVICCGGAFFMARGIKHAATEVNAEGNDYASESALAICTKWNYSELKRRLDTQTAKPDVPTEASFASDSKDLGPMAHAATFTTFYTSVKSIDGDSQIEVRTRSEADFAHGGATITFDLFRRAGEWKIGGMQIQRHDGPVTSV